MDKRSWIIDGPVRSQRVILLAHGAGAPMDSEFMNAVAENLAARKYRVVRFEFPYMRRRRAEGTKSPPDREPRLKEAWLEVIAEFRKPVVLAGKSLGGRIASLIADQSGAAGLACLGYPFHPVGKVDKARVAHLATIRTPTLILQGERDPFGKPGEVSGYQLSPQVRVVWLADGDHGWKPRKTSGLTWTENLRFAIQALDAFAAPLLA